MFPKCSSEYQEEINHSIYQRNIPSHPLDNQYISRPVKTRQTLFPVVDHMMSASSFNPCIQHQTHIYHPEHQYNPGQSAPFMGWANSINYESRLRNLYMPLQKGCIQGEYIPSSTSTLYTHEMKNPYINEARISRENEFLQSHHPFLQDQDRVQHKPPARKRHIQNLGTLLFHNHTRYQVKDLDETNIPC